MRPNLSVEKIAGALAVLGTSVLMAACGGEEKPAQSPVNSTEAPKTDAKPADKAADGHCGAGKDHKPGEASCGAKPGDAPAAAGSAATPAAASSAAPAAAASGAAAAAPAAAAADPKADPKKDAKKPGTPAPGGKKGGGASCGAGTCSAKK